MKQPTNHQINVKSQISGNNGEYITGAHETHIHIIPKTTKSNTIQVQNIGKDPPGRCLSPDAVCCLDPDKPAALIKNNLTLFITEFQIFKQIQNPNFFNN